MIVRHVMSSEARDLPSHVVAALLQFHHSLAAVASLPALLLRHRYQTIGLLILWTLSSCMKLAVAKHTYFGLT